MFSKLNCSATLNVPEVKLIFTLVLGSLLFLKWVSSSKLKILVCIWEIHISNKKILHLLDLGDICLIKLYVSIIQGNSCQDLTVDQNSVNFRGATLWSSNSNWEAGMHDAAKQTIPETWDSSILEPKTNFSCCRKQQQTPLEFKFHPRVLSVTCSVKELGRKRWWLNGTATTQLQIRTMNGTCPE